MSKLFTTGFEVPVAAERVPLLLSIGITPTIRQPLYFERVYLDSMGAVLAIRSTLITGRGMLLLQDVGPYPAGTRRIAASVTNQNRATEPDPVTELVVKETPLPMFATALDVPQLFGDYHLQLAMGIGKTRQRVYLERVYLTAAKQQIAIRSDEVLAREMLVGFNIHVPEPLAGTRYINVRLTNQMNASIDIPALEYEPFEHNELEYN